MKLSAPIHELRSQAKQLKREQQISLTAAQNKVAEREGFVSWSQLVSAQKNALPNSLDELSGYLNPGDLVLLGARPRLGKVRVAARLIADAAIGDAPRSYLFTLAERAITIRQMIEPLLSSPDQLDRNVTVDSSENICADWIIKNLDGQNIRGSLVVVDYLQALDERRVNPPLQQQLESLKTFAKDTQCILLFIAQLKREVDERPNTPPQSCDVRLPNPADLQLLNKHLFLYKESTDEYSNTDGIKIRISNAIGHEFTLSPADLGLSLQ